MKPTNLQSVCILGRQPELGLAELESLYGPAAISVAAGHVAGLALPVNAVDFSRLGGSTRLAEVIAVVPGILWKDVEKQLAASIMATARVLPEGKLQLGFSTFGIPITPAKLNATALTIKKIVRAKTGRSVRIIPNPELELNTAQVQHNHLLGSTGIEMLILAAGNSTLLARTAAVQDIDSYSLRDRGRPKRDARVGMLPPKLAQVLINLGTGRIESQETSVKKQAFTILDPFCGTGVLLQEAMLMGYHACGTDLEPRMIDYSQANLEWLCALYDIPHASFCLQQGDATTHQWSLQPDCVAGETYLGRPFTEKPAANMLAQTVREVNLILTKFLKNIHGQLAPGTRLCLAVPAWALQPKMVDGHRSMVNDFKHLPLIDQISDLGYNRISFEHVRSVDLIYHRLDQIVARQLLVVTRQ